VSSRSGTIDSGLRALWAPNAIRMQMKDLKFVAYAASVLAAAWWSSACSVASGEEEVSASEDELSYTAGRCDRVIRQDGDDKLCSNAYGSYLDEGAVVYRKTASGGLRVLQRLLSRTEGHGGFTSIGDAVYYAPHGGGQADTLAVRDPVSGRYAKTLVSSLLVPVDFSGREVVGERCRRGRSPRTGQCGMLCIAPDHALSYTPEVCAPPICVANVATGMINTLPSGSSLASVAPNWRACTAAEASTLRP
jgi:hypothetical protein